MLFQCVEIDLLKCNCFELNVSVATKSTTPSGREEGSPLASPFLKLMAWSAASSPSGL